MKTKDRTNDKTHIDSVHEMTQTAGEPQAEQTPLTEETPGKEETPEKPETPEKVKKPKKARKPQQAGKPEKKQTPRQKKTRILVIILAALAVLALIPLTINIIVKTRGGKHITGKVPGDFGADCILVLGCGVRPDGEPSDMLVDRIRTAVALYEEGVAPKLLMSGDHGTEDYDEVNAMKACAVEMGVPPEDVFMDHAGFSTYESIYRAKEVFGVKKCVVVTQKYHLYRTLYLCEAFEIEALGVSASLRNYYAQTKRDVREVVARCKDFCFSIVKPLPKYLGEAIDITGDGNVTNDTMD